MKKVKKSESNGKVHTEIHIVKLNVSLTDFLNYKIKHNSCRHHKLSFRSYFTRKKKAIIIICYPKNTTNRHLPFKIQKKAEIVIVAIHFTVTVTKESIFASVFSQPFDD